MHNYTHTPTDTAFTHPASTRSLQRLDHLYYINCWMMRKMKTNFCLITLKTNSPSISSFMVWCDESIRLHHSICMHPFQLPPIYLWWTPGWGQLAQPKGKLTVLSGKLIATSVHMGTSFVLYEASIHRYICFLQSNVLYMVYSHCLWYAYLQV